MSHRRAKVKKIKVAIGAQDADLAEMFNQMLGTGMVNLTIAYPRYKRIQNLCTRLVTLFEVLATSGVARVSPYLADTCAEILAFCTSSRAEIAEMFTYDFTDYEWNLTLVDDEVRKQFTENYENMKRSPLMNNFIIMSDRLAEYKKSFQDLEALNPQFVNAITGHEWIPFPFTRLNIKEVFMTDGVSTNTINCFMTVFHKAFMFGRELFKELRSPDVDVDQFVTFIMNSIDKIQKHPKLSRCKEAFNKIKESVELLKSQFNNYYHDFIVSKDSTIIMQHFIIDVSKTTKASPRITQQFKTIMMFYRDVAKNNASDPKIMKLFDRVSASFADLERGTNNTVNIDNTSSSSEEEEAPAEDAVDIPARERAATMSVDDLVREINAAK